MPKQRIETYEQGTGKLLSVREIEVPEPEKSELELLKEKVDALISSLKEQELIP